MEPVCTAGGNLKQPSQSYHRTQGTPSVRPTNHKQIDPCHKQSTRGSRETETARDRFSCCLPQVERDLVVGRRERLTRAATWVNLSTGTQRPPTQDPRTEQATPWRQWVPSCQRLRGASAVRGVFWNWTVVAALSWLCSGGALIQCELCPATQRMAVPAPVTTGPPSGQSFQSLSLLVPVHSLILPPPCRLPGCLRVPHSPTNTKDQPQGSPGSLPLLLKNPAGSSTPPGDSAEGCCAAEDPQEKVLEVFSPAGAAPRPDCIPKACSLNARMACGTPAKLDMSPEFWPLGSILPPQWNRGRP